MLLNPDFAPGKKYRVCDKPKSLFKTVKQNEQYEAIIKYRSRKLKNIKTWQKN